jgi:hypothetical protein
MTGPTVSAVVLAQDRRAFLADAVRSAIDAGADEVIVVRNFSDPIPGTDGRIRDLRCERPETGWKHAMGLEAATGELVAFLDDDDLWERAKVARLREIWSETPGLVYLCHSQRSIDASGAPADAHHSEYAGRQPERFARWDRSDFGDLADRIWPGNGSSTVVRRSWALPWIPSLREVGWSADTFWLVAAVLSGQPMTMRDEPLTRLRLHGQNMSHARGSTPGEFRARHAQQSQRFAHAFEGMAQLATGWAGADVSIGRYLTERAVDFRFFADLEQGVHPRGSAAHAVAHGGRGRDPGAYRAALVALVSPGLARRLLYRSHQHRWRLS